MSNLLKELVHIEKDKAYHILNQAVDFGIELQLKIVNEKKILNTKLKKIGDRKIFYLISRSDTLLGNPESTLKIIIQNKLFFLKATIKKVEGDYYFDNYEHMYELIRRKKQRFQVPGQWAQTAVIQATVSKVIQSTIIQYAEASNGLRSAATIIEMSKSGMKLAVIPHLPSYEKNQIIKLKFKIFRRSEIQLNAKIIHLIKSASSGPTIGVQFMDDTILLKNKIQNVCDDLAFFYAAEADT